jgi:hypothetical protein
MINIRAAVDGLKVGEVGSIEHRRIHGETNLNTFRDGARVLRTIFSEYGRMRRARKSIRRPGTVTVRPRTSPESGPTTNRLEQVNRNTPAANAHPADPRSTGAHVNRGAFHEVGTRRTDDIKKRLQARAALED